MRYLCLGVALVLAGCGLDDSPRCSDPQNVSAVLNVASRNMDHLSKLVFDPGDILAMAYTSKRPTIDAITTIESTNNTAYCRAVMHLYLDENNIFAQAAKEQGATFVPEQKFLVEYTLNTTDNGEGVLVNLKPLEKASK